MLGSLPGLAHSQDNDEWRNWPLGDKFVVSVGAFVANLDTRARVDATNGLIGTQIDLEKNFGMSDLEPLPTIQAKWRFARRHQLSLGYFQLRRSGSEITETTIRVGDITFVADLPVSSFFDVDTLNLSYQYSLLFDPKKELAIGFGLSLQDMRLGIEGNPSGTLISDTSSVTAPLPTFSLTGAYAFTDKWAMRAAVGVFAVALDFEYDDEGLEGNITDAGLYLTHQTFENVRFGLGYSMFDLDVSWAKKGKFTNISYNYHGPHIAIAATFD